MFGFRKEGNKAQPEQKSGFMSRLKSGLRRTREVLMMDVGDLIASYNFV